MAAATIIQFWNATPKSENRSASQLPIQAPGKKLFRGTIIVRADAGLTTLHLFQREKILRSTRSITLGGGDALAFGIHDH